MSTKVISRQRTWQSCIRGYVCLEWFKHLIAAAGSALDATQNVSAMAAAFAPDVEADKLQLDITAGGYQSQSYLYSSVWKMVQCTPAHGKMLAGCASRHPEHRRGAEGQTRVTH